MPRFPHFHQILTSRHRAELIPLYEPETTARRKPKALQKAAGDGPATMLDHFVSRAPAAEADAGLADEDEEEDGGPGHFDEDVVMNEDGTMTLDAL